MSYNALGKFVGYRSDGEEDEVIGREPGEIPGVYWDGLTVDVRRGSDAARGPSGECVFFGLRAFSA